MINALIYKRFAAGLIGLLCVALALPALAAAPGDPVRNRYALDFNSALSSYEALGNAAVRQARAGLDPLGDDWVARMRDADRKLIPHERTFFPMMHRPWTRESAVFSNLEGARMWLWSIRDGLTDGATGVVSVDVVGGKVRAELISNFLSYLAKARTLMEGGEFKGSYYEDTLTPVLADYCTYPEDGKRDRPSFDDPTLFDDPEIAPAELEGVDI